MAAAVLPSFPAYTLQPGPTRQRWSLVVPLVVLAHAGILLWMSASPFHTEAQALPAGAEVAVTWIPLNPSPARPATPPPQAQPTRVQPETQALAPVAPSPSPTPTPTAQPTPVDAPVQATAPTSVPAAAPAATDAPAPRQFAPPPTASLNPPTAKPDAQPSFDAAYLDNPQPLYPQVSRQEGEQGRVMLRVHVLPSGLPDRIEVNTSSGFDRLDKAARSAVARWRFVPARSGEQAVAAWVTVPIDFSLK